MVTATNQEYVHVMQRSPFCFRAALVDTILRAQELLNERPEWPPIRALQTFGCQLKRKKNRVSAASKWVSNFYVMRHGCLYYSNGKSGFHNSPEGTFEYIRSDPKPDGLYCIELSRALMFSLLLRMRDATAHISFALTLDQTALLCRMMQLWRGRSSPLRFSFRPS